MKDLQLNPDDCQVCVKKGIYNTMLEQMEGYVCTSCGFCSEETFFYDLTVSTVPKSKPYRRGVHCQQILAILCGIGPEKVPQKDANLIEEFMVDPANKSVAGSHLHLIGPNAIKRACQRLGLPASHASHWMEVRRKLRMEECDSHLKDNQDLILRIKARFDCISIAYDHYPKRRNQSKTSRRNIISLKYLILQICRLEGESWFNEVGKYMKQLSTQYTPDSHNEAWKFMVGYCRENFSLVHTERASYNFDWPYIPLTAIDLIRHCSYFR